MPNSGEQYTNNNNQIQRDVHCNPNTVYLSFRIPNIDQFALSLSFSFTYCLLVYSPVNKDLFQLPITKVLFFFFNEKDCRFKCETISIGTVYHAFIAKINKDGPFAATISINNTYLPVCAI